MSRKILYIVKQIFFIFYIIGLLQLIPNFYELKPIGIIVLIICSSYILLELLSFIIKKADLIYSAKNNILSIMLYIYTAILINRYTVAINTSSYELNITYFKINYMIMTALTTIIIINNIILLKNKK